MSTDTEHEPRWRGSGYGGGRMVCLCGDDCEYGYNAHVSVDRNEPTELDVDALRIAVEGVYRLHNGQHPLNHVNVDEWVDAVSPVLAERIAHARREGDRGTAFRIEVACEGYANLTEADVPESVFSDEDYMQGARDAAEAIRDALRGDA